MSNENEPTKLRTTVIVSGDKELNVEDIKAVLRGAGVAITGAVVLALADYFNKLIGDAEFTAKLGVYGPFIAAIISVLINLVRKYFTTDIYPSDNSEIKK